MVMSPRRAPTFANAVFIPTRTFGAPQTTSVSLPSPASTFKRCSFFDSGWGSTDLISATTTPERSLPFSKISFSTSAVDREKRWIKSILSRPERSTKSEIQFIDKNMSFLLLPYSSSANCDRLFKLPLFKSRMSLIPYFIMASLVRPKPNAKPVYSSGSMPPSRSTAG